jgi:hypothetical protein
MVKHAWVTTWLKSVLETSVWKSPRESEQCSQSLVVSDLTTGWAQYGFAAAVVPKGRAVRAARGIADHLKHQGSVL